MLKEVKTKKLTGSLCKAEKRDINLDYLLDAHGLRIIKAGETPVCKVDILDRNGRLYAGEYMQRLYEIAEFANMVVNGFDENMLSGRQYQMLFGIQKCRQAA